MGKVILNGRGSELQLLVSAIPPDQFNKFLLADKFSLRRIIDTAVPHLPPDILQALPGKK